MPSPKKKDTIQIKVKTFEYGKGNFYDGTLINGKPYGKGRLRFENGDVFIGEFRNGNCYEGKLRTKRGDTYEGKFKKNSGYVDPLATHGYSLHGHGKLIVKGGNVYEGQFKDGMPHGKGKVIFPDKSVYKGKFINGTIYNKTKKKNQTVLYIGQDRSWPEVLKRRYKRVLYLKENLKYSLDKLITYPTKGNTKNKKLKIVIFEHANKKGKLKNEKIILQTLERTLTKIKRYNKDNVAEPVKNMSIVLDSCYGSKVVRENKEFQGVLKKFAEAKIDVRISAGYENSTVSSQIANNKNAIPLYKTEDGFYKTDEWRINENGEPELYKEKKSKTIADFLKDNYLGKEESVDKTFTDAFKTPFNLFRKVEKKNGTSESSKVPKRQLKL